MMITEAEVLLRISAADLETTESSSDPAVFLEGAWSFWLQPPGQLKVCDVQFRDECLVTIRSAQRSLAMKVVQPGHTLSITSKGR